MRFWCLLVWLGGCRTVMLPKVPVPEDDPADAWAQLLGEVVTVDGLVDYDLLEANRGPLDDYVAWIGKDRTPLRSNQRHAFMLNAYNALVLFQVLERGRPASVRDVPGWLPAPGSAFTFETAFLVDGTPTSLHEIDHEYLRFKQLDFRDHAAMNGACKSSPPLRNTLYVNGSLEKQLKEQMMRWVADDARGVRVEDDVAVFSPIFDEAGYDFVFQSGGDDLCTVTARFAAGAKKTALRKLAMLGCPHRFSDFDASLNDASGGVIVSPTAGDASVDPATDGAVVPADPAQAPSTDPG